jgi:prenyl protein peptidase
MNTMTEVTYASAWLNALLHSCAKLPIPLQQAVPYAFGLSAAFVSSLYVLVPRKIRQLDRDDVIQIKWRMAASAAVGFIAVITYPLLVCSFFDSSASESALELLGFTLEVKPVLQVLFHTFVLYLGTNAAALLQIHELVRRQRIHSMCTTYRGVFKTLCVDPMFHPCWPQIRNLWVAPALEELVFRACLVGQLEQSTFSQTQIVWIAPLFFGTAHVHHAYIKWKVEGQPFQFVLVSTMFQFAYTTLFGAYATYIFLKKRSLPAIIVSHQYCNYMGLPDLSFSKPAFGRLSLIYRYRWFVIVTYLIGVIGFIWGFHGIVG